MRCQAIETHPEQQGSNIFSSCGETIQFDIKTYNYNTAPKNRELFLKPKIKYPEVQFSIFLYDPNCNCISSLWILDQSKGPCGRLILSSYISLAPIPLSYSAPGSLT